MSFVLLGQHPGIEKGKDSIGAQNVLRVVNRKGSDAGEEFGVESLAGGVENEDKVSVDFLFAIDSGYLLQAREVLPVFGGKAGVPRACIGRCTTRQSCPDRISADCRRRSV